VFSETTFVAPHVVMQSGRLAETGSIVADQAERDAQQPRRRCDVQDCWAEPLGYFTTCTAHRQQQQEQAEAERQNEAARLREALRTTYDLRQLPRPSRDRLHVYGVRTNTTGFRIVRMNNGQMRVYGTTQVSRSNYRHFPHYVAVQQAGDEYMRYISDAMRATYSEDLTNVLDDPNSAVERWGRIIGHCGHCGRTLTNPESVARGIGPVCYSRMISTRWAMENPGVRQCIGARCSANALPGGSRCQAHQALYENAQLVNPPQQHMCRQFGCTATVPGAGMMCQAHALAGVPGAGRRTPQPVGATQGMLALDELGGGEIL
jgi:hypothetical protein